MLCARAILTLLSLHQIGRKTALALNKLATGPCADVGANQEVMRHGVRVTVGALSSGLNEQLLAAVDLFEYLDDRIVGAEDPRQWGKQLKGELSNLQISFSMCPVFTPPPKTPTTAAAPLKSKFLSGLTKHHGLTLAELFRNTNRRVQNAIEYRVSLRVWPS